MRPSPISGADNRLVDRAAIRAFIDRHLAGLQVARNEGRGERYLLDLQDQLAALIGPMTDAEERDMLAIFMQEIRAIRDEHAGRSKAPQGIGCLISAILLAVAAGLLIALV